VAGCKPSIFGTFEKLYSMLNALKKKKGLVTWLFGAVFGTKKKKKSVPIDFSTPD
jgi:hypothetical protein